MMNKRRLEQLRIAVEFIKQAETQKVKVNLGKVNWDGKELRPFCLKDLEYHIKQLYEYEVRKAKGIACNHHTTKKVSQSTS